MLYLLLITDVKSKAGAVLNSHFKAVVSEVSIF